MQRSDKTNPSGNPLRHKKSIETIQTLNDNLPALQAGRADKANVLRNQLNDTRSQIVLMEAKLRNLRQLKDKHELSNKHNLTRLDFMNSVKERIRNDHQNKQKLRQARAESLETLRHQAEAQRETLLSERRNAEQQLMTIKANDAEEERRKHKQHQYLIRKLKEMDSIEKMKKVERVKELHENSSSRIQDFRGSRIEFAKKNYELKVSNALQEKEKAKNLLQKLKLEEERLLNDVKHSEQAMLSSLYSLETFNPQYRKRFRSDKGKHESRQEDIYSHEEFQK